VSYGLHTSQSAALVLEVLRAGLASYGAPQEVLTDNGTQYVTWRGKSAFSKELEARGIAHVVARPRHPQTLGKIERFWGTLWRECVETAVFRGQVTAMNEALVVSSVRLHELAEESWDRVIDINLKGVWLCMKYEISQMLTQGGGTIVNTASIMGLVGSWSRSGAYNASKHGVVGLTKTAALEYATAGIRVNCVCPGYIRTPLLESLLTSQPAMEAQIVARHPIGRMGQPEEIAEAVLWLCSDAASFVTGHTMTVDGGYVAQ